MYPAIFERFLLVPSTSCHPLSTKGHYAEVLFKKKVALEALREGSTLEEIAKKSLMPIKFIKMVLQNK